MGVKVSCKEDACRDMSDNVSVNGKIGGADLKNIALIKCYVLHMLLI